MSRLPGVNAGRKNGSPWMWSPCVCDRRRWARVTPLSASESPSFRAPVPQSKISRDPSSVTTSTHGVFPP
ncbi:MAG TPA: hypothetical protein VFC31_11885 [Candidatus Limnocylindria bacterium]|nr:hypothetical protein [Candidatus Limnocylindria bacterium]